MTETATWDLGAAHPAYATSKYLGELEVWRGAAEGLAAVIVNPSVVLGPGDWSRSSTRLLRYAHQQHRFYTRGLLNFVDVRDVVAQLLALGFEHPELGGERYILSGGALPLGRVFSGRRRRPCGGVRLPWPCPIGPPRLSGGSSTRGPCSRARGRSSPAIRPAPAGSRWCTATPKCKGLPPSLSGR